MLNDNQVTNTQSKGNNDTQGQVNTVQPLTSYPVESRTLANRAVE